MYFTTFPACGIVKLAASAFTWVGPRVSRDHMMVATVVGIVLTRSSISMIDRQYGGSRYGNTQLYYVFMGVDANCLRSKHSATT